jgi:chemotaxis family two-component system response regulator Rcp1
MKSLDPVIHNCAFLHVEDDDATAYLFRAALDTAGVAVSVYRVCDGEHALAFLRKSGIYHDARTPELIVLDANLPKVDGWEVLEQWRRDASINRIPVVFFTTSSHPEDRRRALALGARRFITKPSSFDTLVDEVKSLCGEFLPSPTARPS